MKVYLFSCSDDPAIQAASVVESGANLPQAPCPSGFWDQTGAIDVEPDDETALLPNIDHATLRRCLQEKGWVIDTAAAPEA